MRPRESVLVKLLAVLGILAVVILVPVTGQTRCQETGWFGNGCLYKCRCLDGPQACDSGTGQCPGSGCQPGWFGPGCQHADLANGQPLAIANGTGLQRNITNISSGTCKVGSSVEVNLIRKYSISWIRLLTPDTASWNESRVYVADKGANTTQECTGQGSAVVQWAGGGLVDFHCKEALFGDTVKLELSGNVTSVVCSLHVDGGRNMALRGAASQIGTYEQDSPDRAVDGGTDQSPFSLSCSRTTDNAFSFGCSIMEETSEPWWQVVMPNQAKVVRFVLYTRQGNEGRLAELRMYTGNGSPRYDGPLYQQGSDPNAVPPVLRVSLQTAVTADRVALQLPGDCQVLDFCELEVYGDKPCQSGQHGLECQNTCGCHDVTEVCQPITGGCVSGCPDGFTGLACDQKCNATQYGRDCLETCSAGCRQGTCDAVSGNCTLGCLDGWQNEPKCSRKCEVGFWGPDCSQPCPENCLGACNSIGFCDKCMPGYEGFRCEQICGAGRFGADCQETCSFHCETLQCHQVTGACACKSGYKLDLCVDPCDATTWGKNCTLSCSTGCNQQDCDAINGVCQHGCTKGFVGDFCDEACGRGKFGQDCAENCSIRCTDSLCDHINGRCIKCPQGFKGDFCDSPCEAGRWGNRCVQTCSENCGGDTQDCRPTDGVCINGCADGWRGQRCLEGCLPGTFGANCSQTCSSNCLASAVKDSPCDRVTGYCPQGCQEGFTGVSCLTQASPSVALMGGVAAGVFVAILVILVIAVLVFRRRRGKSSKTAMSDDSEEETGNVRLSAAFGHVNTAYVGDGKAEGFVDDDEASDVGISMATGSDGERNHHGVGDRQVSTQIASRDLPAALDKWRIDFTQLLDQFDSLPRGLISTTSVALNVSNKPKNRYKNICAYDDTRVKLNIINGDPNSDYINASHVEGYDGQTKFIASQGPNAVILNDFLRMLWEKHVTTVVMLTNLIEGGKHKCEQYWPDSGEKKYGTIAVTLLSTRATADYVIRTLQLAKDGRKMQVTQHHFISWPDKGVPMSPWPLVDFHMVVTSHLSTQPPEQPVVVHCSAGIGRTGTYIAMHNLLCESAAIMSLDFKTCVWKLRQARVNMVQTLEQYCFLHEAVMVGQAVSGSLHGKGDLANVVYDLGKSTAEGFSKMAAEFKRIGTCQCKHNEDDYEAGRQEENIPKNRNYNILPKDIYRPFLTSSVAGTSDYINAVFLPGYRKARQFVVTQMPLAGTVLDLWRLVGQYPISTIVTFPSTHTTVGDSAPQFLPEEGQASQFGPYKVTGRSYTAHRGYQEGFLNMVKSKRLSWGRHGRGLHVLKCDESNPGPELMLSMAQGAIFGVPEKQLETSLILVVCRNGADMSGVFVAVAQLVHRLGEAEVSVPTVVGHLRTVRPQLVSTLEQYNAIYESMKLFAVNSVVYTNMEITSSTQPQKPPRKNTAKKEKRHSSSLSPDHQAAQAAMGEAVQGKVKDSTSSSSSGTTANGRSVASAAGASHGTANGKVNGSLRTGPADQVSLAVVGGGGGVEDGDDGRRNGFGQPRANGTVNGKGSANTSI